MKRFLTKKFAIEAGIWIVVAIVIFSVIGAVRSPKETIVPEERVAGVKVYSVSQQNQIEVPISLRGQIKAKQSTIIRSLVQGTLQALVPVRTNINTGSQLFRMTNSSIESNYFAALSSFGNTQSSVLQTSLSSNSALNQAELLVSQAEINKQLAEQSFTDAQVRTEISKRQAEDSVIVAYDSGYRNIESVIRFLGGPNLDRFVFEDVLSNDIKILGQIRNLFDASVIGFKGLQLVPDNDLIASIAQLEDTLSRIKNLSSSTWTFLRLGVPGNGYTQALLDGSVAQVGGFIDQLNAIDTQVKAAKNGLQSTIEQNEATLGNLEKSLELAEVGLKNAQTSLEIQQSNTELSQLGASSQLNGARAQLAQAEFQFNNLSLPAPFSGTVIAHKTTIGSQLSPGQEILEIGNLNIIEIDLEVSSFAATAVVLGQPVIINGEPTGRIIEIEAAADLATGKVGIKIEADNADGRFTPGSIADVEFNLVYNSPGAFVVPLKSVKVGQASNTVLVTVGGLVIEKKVQLGQIFGDLVEIVDGLEQGELVIIENGSLLEEGDKVEIEEENF